MCEECGVCEGVECMRSVVYTCAGVYCKDVRGVWCM